MQEVPLVEFNSRDKHKKCIWKLGIKTLQVSQWRKQTFYNHNLKYETDYSPKSKFSGFS